MAVTEPTVRWHRVEKYDPRCNEIVLAPIDHLCRKWRIPMGEDVESPTIHVHYRFIVQDKAINNPHFWAALIDDLPEAYHPKRELIYPRLKRYDALISSNIHLLDYLKTKIGKKPTIFFPGITGQDYYRDRGVLQDRIYHDNPRMAFGFHGSYAFDIEKFARPDWTLLYFSDKPLHVGNHDSIIRMPYQSVLDYHKVLSEFSPDILVQGWPDYRGNAAYKANLKFRESITFSSCLLADDRANIYGIQHGVNGFIWHNIDEFHTLLDTTPVETFRQIGQSHCHQDRKLLASLYDQLVQLAAEKRR